MTGNIYGYSDNVWIISGRPSIHDFIELFPEDIQEGILYGDDDVLCLLQENPVPYYMRNISSGPHNISALVLPCIDDVSVGVSDILYIDERLDKTFKLKIQEAHGSKTRKKQNKTQNLEKLVTIQTKLTSEDYNIQRDAMYDIILFFTQKYGKQESKKFQDAMYRLMRAGSKKYFQEIGGKIVEIFRQREEI